MSKPLIVILPGFERGFDVLKPFAEALAGDGECCFAHSHSFAEEFSDLTVEGTARGLNQGLRDLIAARGVKELYVVGESLSGVIALVLATNPPAGLKGVIAVDPPLSTATLWPLQAAVARQQLRGGLGKVASSQANLALGLGDDGQIRELDHGRLIQAPFAVPVTVITGDVPLQPMRDAGAASPCLLTLADRAKLEARSDVEVIALTETGHTALSERPEVCAAVVREVIAKAGRE